MADDEESWADAEEVLDRWQPEPAERRLAREHQDSRLLGAAVVLTGLAFLLALVLLVVDPPPDTGGEPPVWRAVTGLSVGGTGLVFVVVAFALRAPRQWVPLTWGNPLRELTSRQRKQLLQQVRGRAPLAPERIRLARHSAQDLLGRRASPVVQSGLLVTFIGFWIVDRSLVRTLLTLALVAVFAAVTVHVHRDAVRARRFLDEHPEAGA